jgi:hypothetical protein
MPPPQLWACVFLGTCVDVFRLPGRILTFGTGRLATKHLDQGYADAMIQWRSRTARKTGGDSDGGLWPYQLQMSPLAGRGEALALENS